MLELGAGTGELGVGIADQVQRYVAIEASAEMAKIWRQRFAGSQLSDGALFEQDADRPWPVADRSVDIVFASRAAHWLDRDHVRREFMRVAKPHGVLLLGRVVRDVEHPQPRLRAWMHAELRALGYKPKDGPRQGSELLERLVQASPSASWLPEQWLLSWPFEARLADILERWRRKPGLAGVELPDAERQALLDRVARRAEAELGALDSSLSCGEGYAVQGVALNADAAHGRSDASRSTAAPCVRLTSRFGGPIRHASDQAPAAD